MRLREGTWSLNELAKRAGMTPRTVRYYVQRGLIPAPRFQGPMTGYAESSLVRLQAIRRLQDRFLPLDAIKVELQRMTPEQVRLVAKGGTPPPLAASASAIAPESPNATRDEVATWQRWELAPGLELHLSQSADGPSRELAQKLRDLARAGQDRATRNE
jgi:DNA-binding transcriptional MerR regulator